MIMLIGCIVRNIRNRHSAIFGWSRSLVGLGRISEGAHDDR